MDVECLDQDEALALQLQAQFMEELENGDYEVHEEMSNIVPTHDVLSKSPMKKKGPKTSVIAPEWEDLDPTPDLHALFLQFNDQFFWGRLSGCEVKWSPRMTLCAGVCSYQRRSGYCSIRLSVPLLKLRPRKDLVETLLHEMIHAYLFVTNGDDDHDGHGPAFHSHMYRINKEQGTSISVYHNFHDEVDNYRQHWWKCNGPCQNKRPFYGMVKRSMNRAPGPYDPWFKDHESSCGGTFVKIKEPEGYGQKKRSKKSQQEDENKPKGQKDIREYGKNSTGIPVTKPSTVVLGTSAKTGRGVRGNIHGFGGTRYDAPSSSGISGLKTKGTSGPFVVKPGWKVKDSSASGSVIASGIANKRQKVESQSTPRTATSSEPSDVLKTVRESWTKRYDSSVEDLTEKSVGKSTATYSKVAIVSISEDEKEPASRVEKNSSKVKCPVCSGAIDSSVINQHLDECLKGTRQSSNPFVDDDESNDAVVVEDKTENRTGSGQECITIDDDQETYPCPACNRQIPVDQINSHLDDCAQ